jgi:cell division protein FtsQ
VKSPAVLPMDIRLMQGATRAVLSLGALLCVAAVLWWVVRLPVFSLQAITVQGEVTRNNAVTLKTNVVPHLQGNFFTLPLSEAKQAFEAVPWVRSAVVHREFPNRLRVDMQEHQPLALWGEEGGGWMLNQQGQVFEANVDDAETEGMPRLKGAASQSQEVLAMYRLLRPMLQSLDMDIDELEMSPRGSWRLLTDRNAVIELGRGTPQEVGAQLQLFLRTLSQVTARYGRTPRSLAAADLRHKDGYALRLHGVTTLEADPRKKP